MNVIANTTVISNFASAGRLEVLHQLLTEVFISTDVYGELQDGLAAGIDYYTGIEDHMTPFSPEGWLHLTSLQSDDELRLFNRLPSGLHRGEASCLAIAASRSWVFVTDDFQARKAAHTLGNPISGTIGLLIQAVKQRLISTIDADSLPLQMIANGYRSPHVTISELLP